jgi:hypothetical protein
VVTQGVDTGKYARDVAAGAVLRKRWGASEGEPVFAFIGRLEPIKGVGSLLQAATELAADRIRCKFVIIGSGTQEAALRRFAAERGLGQSVVFTGWLDDVSEALSGIDVLVLPSLNERSGGYCWKRSQPVSQLSLPGRRHTGCRKRRPDGNTCSAVRQRRACRVYQGSGARQRQAHRDGRGRERLGRQAVFRCGGCSISTGVV